MPVPILSVEQMRQWERATWATGRTEAAVIRQVGERVAARARQMTRAGDRVLLLAGKGHNGDDARQAQPHLADRVVELLNVSDPAAELDRLQIHLDRKPALVVDGLFGIGLNRPLNEAWTRFIATVEQAGCPVLSVDVPSGLDADTGETHGAALRAAITLTLAAPKPGLLRAAGWPFVGRLEVASDIGLIPCPVAGSRQWTLPGDFAGFPPARRVEAHKGSFGHLLIVAGSLGYHGAAVLAARGAERAKPGLITLVTPEEVYGPVAAQLQSVMVHPWRTGLELPPTASAILIGPGLAARQLPADLRETAVGWWRESRLPVIVDASALDWLPAETPPDALRVLTPHPGEAGRMLERPGAAVQADRFGALADLARRWSGCRVVLKGHQTLVGDRDGVFVNCSGNPYLAQGGSGDVLAGYLGGLLAQPALQADPMTTLRYGVWQHGAAADALQQTRGGWTMEDLVGGLGTQLPGNVTSARS
ncbi:MAG: NAD(P)H-hydrate dehydratase [Verrucomicrobia bacterium]|nr:NAD(P)H-hydrate dehydratase [Verrucomicrobiota bacterium]